MNIDEIKRMLDRYYEGESTPSETALLKEFFQTAEEIPADMSVDAAVFRALAEADKAEVEVPADLKERIVSVTTGARPRFLSWRPMLAAAASAAVLISLSVALFRPAVSSDVTEQLAMADTVRHIVVPESPTEVSVTAEAQITVPSEPAEPEVIARAEPVRKAAETKSAYTREVTDPAETAEIAIKVLKMLGKSLDKAEDGIKRADEAVARMNDPFNGMFDE